MTRREIMDLVLRMHAAGLSVRVKHQHDSEGIYPCLFLGTRVIGHPEHVTEFGGKFYWHGQEIAS